MLSWGIFFPWRGSPGHTIVSPSREKRSENGDSSRVLWSHNSNVVSSTPLLAELTAAPTHSGTSNYTTHEFTRFTLRSPLYLCL